MKHQEAVVHFTEKLLIRKQAKHQKQKQKRILNVRVIKMESCFKVCDSEK